MKFLHAACLLAFVPLLASAQSVPDNTERAKPIDPIIARDHDGQGRIGVRLIFDKNTGLPQIAAMTRGGPACDFGFKIGDVIIKIGRNYTSTLSPDEIRLALHGQPGTGVELTVQRGDNPKLIVRALERRILPPYSEDMLEQIVEEKAP